MRHYQVQDVMTAGSMTVTPSTPTYLLRKEQLQLDPEGSHSAHLSYRDRRAIATAETAGEIMNPHPATVRLGYAIDDTSRPRPDEPETPRSPVAARRLA